MECIGINESDHMPRLNNNRKKSPPQKKAPCKSNFLAAGFLFARSQLLFEGGIYDPCLPFLFFGEEILLSAKLYTNGWDFFVPNKNIIYTIWDRSYRPSFQELKDKDIVQSLSKQRYLYTMKQISKEMVPDKRLLKNPEFLRMGSKRTLAEFKKVSGLGKYL
jgi:UDP-GlcNAc:polypeptide alpha-N-acetylglucosaminyltransferase